LGIRVSVYEQYNSSESVLKGKSPDEEQCSAGYHSAWVALLWALRPHGGGYETRLSSYTNLEVTANSQIVKAGLDLISRMHPSAIPTPLRADSFASHSTEFGTHVWSYGDNAPELD
jgi:hypothetical protein